MPDCAECIDNDKCQEQTKSCKTCKNSGPTFIKKDGVTFCKLYELPVRENSICSSFKRKETPND